MIKNKFFQQVEEKESIGASPEELKSLLGSGRSRKGMFEGDVDEGELEIGQIAALINEIRPAAEIVKKIVAEFLDAREKLNSIIL
jgi:enoyl-[acyl-carrier protein] reductase II